MSEQAPHTDQTPHSPTRGAVDPILRDAFDQIQADLGQAARAILRDQFDADGIGSMGTYFRSISSLEGARATDEAWSGLLDLSGRLWASGEQDAALRLLENARLRLKVPETFVDSLDVSIAYGKDYLVCESVNARFLEGDETGALGLLEKIEDPDARKILKDDLSRLTTDRARSRRKAFIGAGIMLSFTVMLSGFAFASFLDFLKAPPIPNLPEMDWDNALPKFPEGTTFLPKLPDILDTPIASEAVNPPMPVLDAPSLPREEEATGSTSSDFGSESLHDDIDEASPEARLFNDALVSRECAVALKVAEDLSRQDHESLSSDARETARNFVEMFLTGCEQDLHHVDELKALASTIPASEIEEIVENITR